MLVRIGNGNVMGSISGANGCEPELNIRGLSHQKCKVEMSMRDVNKRYILGVWMESSLIFLIRSQN